MTPGCRSGAQAEANSAHKLPCSLSSGIIHTTISTSSCAIFKITSALYEPQCLINQRLRQTYIKYTLPVHRHCQPILWCGQIYGIPSRRRMLLTPLMPNEAACLACRKVLSQVTTTTMMSATMIESRLPRLTELIHQTTFGRQIRVLQLSETISR